MKEQNEKFTKILVDDLYKYSGISVIKNFIVSDSSLKFPEASAQFEYPYVFEGMAFAIHIRGTARVKVNLVEYDLEPNTIITVLPHTVIEFLEKSNDSLAEFLIFSPEFLSDLHLPPNMDYIEKIETEPCLKISENASMNILDFHAFIVKQYKRTEHLYRAEIVKTLLLAMFTEIASIYNIPRRSPHKELTHRAELFKRLGRLLFKHHRQERSVSFYAGQMCLTPKYLSKIIKEASGKSVLEWVNDTVVSTSKALLMSSNMTVLQISEELNFPNPSFFGRYFKQHAGMTPKEYQNQRYVKQK